MEFPSPPNTLNPVARAVEFLAVPAALCGVLWAGIVQEEWKSANHAAQVVQRLETAGMVGATVEAERDYQQQQRDDAVVGFSMALGACTLTVAGLTAHRWVVERA